MSALGRHAYPLAVAAAAFLVAAGLPPRDSDMYWHLATGKWMWDHGAILRNDVFSSTVAGQPYAVGQWLGELVLSATYRAAEWPGVVVLRALLVATCAFFVVRVVRRGAPLAVSLPLVIAALLVSSITWTDRPQLWTLALFPLLLDVLLDAREGDERRLVVLPPLFLLWANLHGGYALGLAVVGAFTLDALVRTRGRARRWLVIAVLAGLATFLNPAPFDAGITVREDAVAPPRFLTEFLPPDVTRPAGLLFALFAAGALAAAAARGGSRVDVLLLGPLLWLALSAQRHMPFFAIAAAAFIAPRAGAFVPPRVRAAALSPRAAAALALVLCAAAIAALPATPARPDERAYPVGALADVRSGSGTLLNEYDWGGYLIWNAPERPVFIDGRYVPYLHGVLADYRDAVDLRPRWRAVLDRYDVREVLLRPSRALAVALEDDGWRVVSRDDVAILLRRP